VLLQGTGVGLYGYKWDKDQKKRVPSDFEARFGDFSEQNAIECVDFFIDIMTKSQLFSARLPVVGGDVHIALITKTRGFEYVSREELRHGEHAIEIKET